MVEMTPNSAPINPQQFVFAMIGFSEAEQSLLASTFRLTSRRAICYVEPDKSASAGVSAQRPDIYLINADNPEALQTVQVSAAQGNIKKAPNQHAPAVMMGRKEVDVGWPFVKKPIHWIRLFEQLDEVMRQALRERLQRTQLAVREQHGAAAWDGCTFRREADRLTSDILNNHVSILHPKETVLVVDDSATVRAFMRIKLAPFQFDVDYAENGEQAVAMAKVKPYTCIFLDIMMPGIDGYEVCKQIKGNQVTKKTAVVMLTSKSSMLDKFRAVWSGCDAYLGKPVIEDDLLATIAKFLPGSQAVEKF
jgi:twitching motility two-component system response regulator PilG